MSSDTLSGGGLVAASAISQYRFIENTTYPSVQHCNADTDRPLGLSTSAAAIGESVQYELLDGKVRLVEASAAISANDRIACTTAGKAKTAASADVVVGKAMEAASADGDVIRCLVFHGWLLA